MGDHAPEQRQTGYFAKERPVQLESKIERESAAPGDDEEQPRRAALRHEGSWGRTARHLAAVRTVLTVGSGAKIELADTIREFVIGPVLGLRGHLERLPFLWVLDLAKKPLVPGGQF